MHAKGFLIFYLGLVPSVGCPNQVYVLMPARLLMVPWVGTPVPRRPFRPIRSDASEMRPYPMHPARCLRWGRLSLGVRLPASRLTLKDASERRPYPIP